MWKDAIIIPVLKSQYATCEDEVRAISVTACLSKILVDFVVKWMLKDIEAIWQFARKVNSFLPYRDDQ